MIELRLFGNPRLLLPARTRAEPLSRQPKRLALLAYMASSAGLHRRDRLVGTFWPDSDDAHARGALSQALHVLRAVLGDGAVMTVGQEEVGIDPAIVRCDVVAFEDALASGRLDEALELYRGELLDGLFISGAQPFELWLDQERDRLRRRAVDAASKLADTHAAAGMLRDAVRYARRAVAITSADENAVTRLMTLLHAAGDRAGALDAYDALATLMVREYDLEPSPATQKLASTIRDTNTASVTSHATAAPVARPGPAAAAAVSVTAVPAADVTRPSTFPTHMRVRRAKWPLIALAGAVAVAAAVLLPVSREATDTASPLTRFRLEFDGFPAMASGVPGTTIVLSADGSRLVYVGTIERRRQLFLRAMDTLAVVPLANTEGATVPFFSPDGESVGFAVGSALRRVPIDGGVSATMAIVPYGNVVSGASWGETGIVVFTTGRGLWRVAAEGGEPELFAVPQSRGETYGLPHVLPGGRSVLFTIADSAGFHLAAALIETGVIKRLGVDGTNPIAVSPDRLVFARSDGDLLTARLDARTLRITGPAVPIVRDAFVGVQGAAKAGVSSTGVVAYVPNTARHTLARMDRQQRIEILANDSATFTPPRVSPDGQSFMVAMRPRGGFPDLWRYDVESGTRQRITFDGSGTGPAVWTPDGDGIAFRSKPGGNQFGYTIRSLSFTDYSGTAILVPPAAGLFPVAFSKSGDTLVFERRDRVTGGDIWLLPLHGARDVLRYYATPANEREAAMSPDGRRIAFVSDESGRDEIYIAQFPRPGTPVRVSVDGGRVPRWAADGHELFYMNDVTGLMSITLDPASLRVTDRSPVFDDIAHTDTRAIASYDVLPDDRFIVILEKARSNFVQVVLNAFGN